MRSIVVALTLFVIGIPVLAQIATPQHGDLLITSYCVDPFGLCMCSGGANVFAPSGEFRFLSVLPERCQTVRAPLLSHPDGSIYGLYPFYVFAFSPAFQVTASWPVPGARDLAIDARLNVFALDSYGTVSRLQPGLGPEPVFHLPLTAGHEARSMDFGLDGCTLHYMEARSPGLFPPHLRRFDVCRNVPLSDVEVSFEGCHSPTVRIGPDGAIHVSSCWRFYRIRPDGVRSYAIPGTYNFSLAADGHTFWITSGDRASNIDLETGTSRDGPSVSNSSTIAIYGVPRAAAAAGLLALPALSPVWLAFLAIAVSLVAIFRLTR